MPLRRTPVRVGAAALLAVASLTACTGGGPSARTVAPTAPPGAVATLPVGITPTMTTWGETVELPGVGSAVFTREGSDAVVRLTASAPGIRVGLSRAAYTKDGAAFGCSGQVVEGPKDGAVAAGTTSTIEYEGCAVGQQFAWNYMVDDQRTLSVGVEEG